PLVPRTAFRFLARPPSKKSEEPMRTHNAITLYEANCLVCRSNAWLYARIKDGRIRSWKDERGHRFLNRDDVMDCEYPPDPQPEPPLVPPPADFDAPVTNPYESGWTKARHAQAYLNLTKARLSQLGRTGNLHR